MIDHALRPAAAAVRPGSGRAIVARVNARLLGLTLLLMVGAAAALSVYAIRQFDAALAPELGKKATVIGRVVAADLSRAVGYGIPFDRLVGVEEYLGSILEGHAELQFATVADAAGRPLYRWVRPGADAAGDGGSDIVDVPVAGAGAGAALGSLRLGIDPGYVQGELDDILFDGLVTMLVALLVAFELLLGLVMFNIIRPMGQLTALLRRAARHDLGAVLAYRANDEIGRIVRRVDQSIEALYRRYAGLVARTRRPDGEPEAVAALGRRLGLAPTGRPARFFEGGLIDARTPLFVFVFAEELQKSFMPLFVGQLYQPIPFLSVEMVLGLPISIYMLVLAVATPLAGAWSDRLGSRRIFLLGLVPAVLGYVGLGFASTLYELLVWRALTAIGYAMITIACQGYIAQVTDADNRARGMAVFVGALMTASICGTAIGGILADRIGYRAVFLIAAALTLLAGLFARRMLLGGAAPAARPRRRKLRLRDFALVLRNGRFVALLLLAAIPAKILLTGFLFYLVPLHLFDLGADGGEIGRIMMIYSIVVILLGPSAARLADRWGLRFWLTAVGSLASGLGVALSAGSADTWALVAAVAALGLGHALAISPQIALVPDICDREIAEIGQTTVLSVLRTLERVGSVAGPFLVAALVAGNGYEGAMRITGYGVSAAALGLVAWFLWFGRGAAAPGREVRP